MRGPVIRYPLFWIIGGLALWLGHAVARPWLDRAGSELATRWTRVVEGPPVPRSSVPEVVAGAILRTALLLEEDVAATDRPGGRTVEVVGARLLARVYDVWPTAQGPTHYRIGNDERAFGWVPAEVVLPWDTRLVVKPLGERLLLAESPGGEGRAEAVGVGTPLPVLGWKGDAIEVATWGPDSAWREVGRTGWMDGAGLKGGEIGVLMSRGELLALIRGRVRDPSEGAGRDQRMRALIGRLADPRPIPADELGEALAYLPGWVAGSPEIRKAGDLLETYAALNAAWRGDVEWSGISFAVVPLDALP